MPEFKTVVPQLFCDTVLRRGSRDLVRQWQRCMYSDPTTWAETGTWHDPECVIHAGPLVVAGDFRAPEFNTLILGDLTVEGLIDGGCGADMSGLFVVLGHVSCRSFMVGDERATVFIEGDLMASDIILTGIEDASLTVIGDFGTRFFYGNDIWAEVGGEVHVLYGDGYCLPIGFEETGADAIRPRHGKAASRRMLAVEEQDDDIKLELMELLRDGKPVFR